MDKKFCQSWFSLVVEYQYCLDHSDCCRLSLLAQYNLPRPLLRSIQITWYTVNYRSFYTRTHLEVANLNLKKPSCQAKAKMVALRCLRLVLRRMALRKGVTLSIAIFVLAALFCVYYLVTSRDEGERKIRTVHAVRMPVAMDLVRIYRPICL